MRTLQSRLVLACKQVNNNGIVAFQVIAPVLFRNHIVGTTTVVLLLDVRFLPHAIQVFV
jgi:hypothetical protein